MHVCVFIYAVALIRCSVWVTASLWCMLFFNFLYVTNRDSSWRELFLVGVCLNGWWAASGWADCKDDGMATRSRNWVEWAAHVNRGRMEKVRGGVNDIIPVSVIAREAEKNLWQGMGEVRVGEKFGLPCCPQPEALTTCQWWISDTASPPTYVLLPALRRRKKIPCEGDFCSSAEQLKWV